MTSIAADKDKQRLKRNDRRSELICRVKYGNALPDLPFDPKFIIYPFDSNRFVQYKPTSLEKNHKHDLLTELDLGVKIDLVDPDIYNPPTPPGDLPPGHQAQPTLAIEDERLLEEEQVQQTDQKRSRHHNKVVPWLKKTEYISTEFNRYGASSEKSETKVGYNIKKQWKDENPYMDKESQIAAIDKTFNDAKKTIKEHHSKKGVTPIEILEVFPDYQLWKYPFAQVQFDADPAPMSQIEEMSQAMIRGVMDESGEQFVAYFLPTKETLNKRLRDEINGVDYDADDEYEYDMAREYNWNVKSKNSKGYEENYFFVFRDDGVYFNELETRVRLTKRRVKADQTNHSKLIVKHRQLNEIELKTQEIRLHALQPPQEEEEEEEEEEEDVKNQTEEKKVFEVPQKSDDSGDSEDEKTERKTKRRKIESDDEEKNEKSAASSSASSSDSGSGSSSSSDESNDDKEDFEARRKKNEAEIFGSDESESD